MASGNSGTVLIVEDDPGVLRLEELVLQRAGFAIRTAPDAATARNIIEAGGIDLIVLDYSLNDNQNGVEFYQALQAAGKSIPAILVTGFSEESRIIEAMRAGIRDFLPKRSDYLDTLPISVGRVMDQLHGERELAAAEGRRELAEAENRAKDEFLAVLSHELRTPLTAMLGWTKLIQSGKLDEPTMRRAVEVIERNTKAQARLVDDLLDVSRIICGKLELADEPMDVWKIVSEVCEGMRPNAESKGVKLECHLLSAEFQGRGDQDRIRQVMTNLVSNAVKFTPSGGRVNVTCAHLGSMLQVQVEDTGIGISPEFLPHVFDRFSQAETGAKRNNQGLGLGLTIARHLIELHGGKIHVDSKGKGTGTKFSILLPRNVKVETSLLLKGSPTPPLGIPAPSMGGIHALVIEDTLDSQDLLRVLLESNGAVVTTASNAVEALKAFAAQPPDVILSDIGLPDCDGFELLEKIRQLPGGFEVPVLALTALASHSIRQRAMTSGFQAYIPKPVDPQVLIGTITKLIQTTRSHKN